MASENSNYKSLLNQYCQKKKIGPAIFETSVIEEGCMKGYQSHVVIAVTKFELSGIHSKKRAAESEAARLCLENLGFLNNDEIGGSLGTEKRREFDLKNPKTVLNEHCQKMKIAVPVYETKEQTNGSRILGFLSTVIVQDTPYCDDKIIYPSKRDAEHHTAAMALSIIRPNAIYDLTTKSSKKESSTPTLYSNQGISYKNLLLEHISQRNFDKPIFETTFEDDGYKCSVTVEGKIIKTDESFPSKKLAEHNASKEALITLGVKDPEKVAINVLRRRSKGTFKLPPPQPSPSSLPTPVLAPGPFRASIPRGNESETWIHTRAPIDFDNDSFDEISYGYTDFQQAETPYFQKRSLDSSDGETPKKRQRVDGGHMRRTGGFMEVADVHLGNLTVGEVWVEKRNVVIIGSDETSIPLYCNGERGRCALEEIKTSEMIDIKPGHRLVGLEGRYIERGGQINLIARKCDEIIMPEIPDKVLVSCGIVVMHCIPRKTDEGTSCDVNILLKRYLCSQAFVNVVRGMAQFFRNMMADRSPKIDRELLSSNVSKWMLEEVMAMSSMSEDSLKNVFRHTMKFDRRWGKFLTFGTMHEDLIYMQTVANEELARRASSQEDQNQDRFRPWRLPKGNFHHRILSTGVFIESPAECAMRELREETGIRLKLNDISMSPYVDIPQDDNLNPHKGDVSRYFLCGIITEDENASKEKVIEMEDTAEAMSESLTEDTDTSMSTLDQSSSSIDNSFMLSPSVYGALHEECTWYDVDTALETSEVFKEVYQTQEFQTLMENLKKVVTDTP